MKIQIKILKLEGKFYHTPDKFSLPKIKKNLCCKKNNEIMINFCKKLATMSCIFFINLM